MKKSFMFVLFVAVLFLAGSAMATTIVGNGGTMGANGVVTLAPDGTSSYGYVSTSGGVDGNVLSLGGTNGSTLRTDVFAANAGDDLKFYFNYVTSDGGGYADYAWARLLYSSGTEAALLFTARTTPGGDTVPGFGMPALNATLEPAATPIIDGAPAWSALGSSSGSCWSTGCGYTGWIKSTYEIADAGNYILEFGAANWTDTAFDSGLAFSGITIADVEVPITSAPEPATMMLLGLGLMGLAGIRRKMNG